MPREDSSADRYNPPMPAIPGVPAGGSAGRGGGRIRPVPVLAALAIVLLLLACLGLWIHNRAASLETAPPTTALAEQQDPASPSAATTSPATAAPSVDASAEIASVADLSKPWSSRAFTFVLPLTHEGVPAMIVRLPDGAAGTSAGYWAFSSREPFGSCQMVFVTDLGALASQYGFAAKHPMLVDPCTQTVFDPLHMGQRSDGAWVRGEIVQGGGLRPPLAIELSVHNGALYAVRME